jgi:hypothetical protein
MRSGIVKFTENRTIPDDVSGGAEDFFRLMSAGLLSPDGKISAMSGMDKLVSIL